jgi:ABC-2 type transport system permease protein
MSALKAIMQKEWQHILRDKATLFMLLIWPVVMLLFFGYAISFELRQVDILVVNPGTRSVVEQQIHALKGSGFFHVRVVANYPADTQKLFRTRQAKAVLFFPLVGGTPSAMIDGSDPNTAQLIAQYMTQSLFDTSNGAVQFEPRFLYNPDLRSAVFFVPGLAGIIMLMLSALLTSIALVKEKERGSLAGLIISPVRSRDIILGKVLPYATLAWLSGILVVVAGVLVFSVPFRGNVVLVALVMALYVLAGTSMGMLISSIAKSQQVALLMTLMITMLPTIMLSGFMFPIESMPTIFQWISNIIPATHFIRILREVLLKGNGVFVLWKSILCLMVISAVLLRASLHKLGKVLS